MAAEIAPDTIIHAQSDTTSDAIQEARAYISKYQLTADDVRLIKVEDQVRVVTKRPVILEENK